jgi:hypothetical protein
MEPKSEKEYDIVVPTATPAVFKYLRTICDFVFCYEYVGLGGTRHRVLHVRGDEERVDCAVGVDGHFMDKKGKELSIIDMGTSAKAAYKNLCLAFDNKVNNFTTEED